MMFSSTKRPLAAMLVVLSGAGLSIDVAKAQQCGVIVQGRGGSTGVYVSGGGVGSASISGRDGTQGIVVDAEGRVRRFSRSTPAGTTVGAFAGGGSSGIATSNFDPFNFVFGSRGFPGSAQFGTYAPADVIDLNTMEGDFRRGDLRGVIRKAEDAARFIPGDSEIEQLRALALFALGHYPEAGRAVRGVLSSGLSWDWSTVRRLYDSDEAYVSHYQALRSAAATHPESAETLLLLAYHDLVLGRLDAAREAARALLALRPDDHAARDLLATLPPELKPGSDR